MSLESRVLWEAADNLGGTDPQETKAQLRMAAAEIDELRAVIAAGAAQNSQLLEELEQLKKKPEGWVSVTDKMPDAGATVLACYKNSHNLIRRIRAMWVAAKSVESGWESDLGEYDEESDTYYDPEGWYEKIENWEEFTALLLDKPVTHWMPLPPAPKEPT